MLKQQKYYTLEGFCAVESRWVRDAGGPKMIANQGGEIIPDLSHTVLATDEFDARKRIEKTMCQIFGHKCMQLWGGKWVVDDPLETK